jgi:S1-C subfamily serine protease
VLALLAGVAASAEAPHYDDQVVALQVTHQPFDEYRPWARQGPRSRAASAVVVEGPLLLTEAQIVRNATLIQVEKHASARRVPARVVHVDHDVDLALLAVDEPGFFDDLEAVRLAPSAPSEGRVRTLRWRSRQLEMSNSRVTRVAVQESVFGSIRHAFLLVTTDLSGGGWAEPVFSNGELIGITVAQDAQNATILPPEIIAAYLDEHGSEAYRGFASFDPFWQHNQDRALAAYLGLEGEPRGIVLLEIPWGSSGCDVLEPRDLLLSLDGHAIDALGNYHHPHYGRLQFPHIALDGRRPGDVVPAQVLRGGRLIDVDIELRRHRASHWLVPWRRNDSTPPYLVAGGLVLRELDGNYLRAWGENWRKEAPSQLVQRYALMRKSQTPERRGILMLSHVLPAAYNLGYHDLAHLAVAQINGRPVDSVRDAEEAFQHPEDGLHRLVFYPDDLRSQVVLDAEAFGEATAEILEAYGVPERIRTRPAGAEPPAAACEGPSPAAERPPQPDGGASAK